MCNGSMTSDPEDKQGENNTNTGSVEISECDVRPSIALHLIRHAESNNNEVYRNARYIYRGGTPDFDEEGWTEYVESNRRADATLSARGFRQAARLADYLVPHLENQASHPVRVIISPMRRTLETIRPTLEKLQQAGGCQPKVHIVICAFYHESEGCHMKGVPDEGMNPAEIRELMKNCVHDESDIEFIGFPDINRGWYLLGTGPETRAQSETRAAKFCMWICDYLDNELKKRDHDLFDAGVQIEGEENEDEHDKHEKRMRRRRTALVVGHGDFMSLVMKRFVAGFGHYVEMEGISHRSAFAHFNTGMSEFEYFGHGRFMIMGTNHTPHLKPSEYKELRSGGSLKDGWSYIMPADKFVLNAEVDIAFADELDDHVHEQAAALRSLYLSSKETRSLAPSLNLDVEQDQGNKSSTGLQFVVKRGLQVVGVATYSEETGTLTDVAIRPSAADDNIGETLIDAVRKHARKLGRSGSMIVHPRSPDSKSVFESLGFTELDGEMAMQANIV